MKSKVNANFYKVVERGIYDGDELSFFEIQALHEIMLETIPKLTKKQIVTLLREAGYEPEDGFSKASKNKLAKELFDRKSTLNKCIAVFFGPGYSN